MKDLFYKPIKVNSKDENILFWGCLHHGHNPEKWDVPLWKRRGFDSVEEHDYIEIKNWNSRANQETIGFLLGDTVFGKGAAERLEILFNRLVFKDLYVMPGNHFSGWKQHFENCEYNTRLFGDEDGYPHKKVIFIPNYLEAFINGQAVVMSHYPILSFNGQGGGAWMLHAHTHGSLQNSEIGKLYYKNTKALEVSVEVNPFPLSFKEIRKELQNKEVKSPDHHGKETQNPF